MDRPVKFFIFIFVMTVLLSGCGTGFHGTASPDIKEQQEDSPSDTAEEEPVIKLNERTGDEEDDEGDFPEGNKAAGEEAEYHIAKRSEETEINGMESMREDTVAGESFYITEIDGDIFARIYGKSFKEDCTLPREDLRYLHVLHRDINGTEHEGEMIVNTHIAEDVLEIFKDLYENGYPIEKIRLVDEYDADDDLSMEDNNSSCFNFRFVPRTKNISKHGRGLAVDINPLYNPYITTVEGKRNVDPAGGEPYADRDAQFDYKIEKGDLCYNLFIEHGFKWGGEWKNSKDYQHFEVSNEKISEWYP